MKKLQRNRRKGVYLLPNLFTTMGLFFGFYAAISAVQDHFIMAAKVIFIAMIFDGLDGRIARITNTTSEFGAEYDSLSDMVTFGIAPAILVYNWGLHSLGKVGWLVAFVYVAATALRLARFNTNLAVISKRYFQGLPSPIGAAVIAAIIWFASKTFNLVGSHVDIAVAVVTMLIALLMVSDVPYYSFKEIDFKNRMPFAAIILFIMLCVAIAVNPPAVLCFGFVLFLLSGPVLWLFRKKRSKRDFKRHN